MDELKSEGSAMNSTVLTKPKPKVIIKKEVPRKKIEIYKDEYEKIYKSIEELKVSITTAISKGNATHVFGVIDNVLKEFKKKLL